MRTLQWLLIAATAGLMIFLKWLHLGVTNYNIFLLIMLGWTLGLVMIFRALTVGRRTDD
jgi:hypothetical protein